MEKNSYGKQQQLMQTELTNFQTLYLEIILLDLCMDIISLLYKLKTMYHIMVKTLNQQYIKKKLMEKKFQDMQMSTIILELQIPLAKTCLTQEIFGKTKQYQLDSE